MMTRKYNMLGKVYQINTIDSFEGEILHKELELYPLADDNPKVDVVVNYLDKLEDKIPTLKNPSTHSYFDQSFRMELINASIEFHFNNGLKRIDFSIKQGNQFRAIANKWFSYQFTNRKESIGFIFHELILIPSAFFFPDLTIIHASGINDNGAILFGGTGGVGKTSLELELCNNYNKSFFADDIVVVNTNGYAFPNLSYPKIYGYNLLNNDELKQKIFGNVNLLNKIHWHARKSIDPAIVRRRVNPIELYNNVTQQPHKLTAFYILAKDGNVRNIEVSKITTKEAARLNRLVLETEYHIFYKHLLWDQFNSIIAQSKPRLDYLTLLDQIENNLNEALSESDSFIIKIPININHNDYLNEMSQIILKN